MQVSPLIKSVIEFALASGWSTHKMSSPRSVRVNLPSGEFIFVELCGDGLVFEPATCRWLADHCREDGLLDEAPSGETIAAAKRLAREFGGDVRVGSLDHVKHMGGDESSQVYAAYAHAISLAATND